MKYSRPKTQTLTLHHQRPAMCLIRAFNMIAVNEDNPIQPHILQGMTRLHMKDEKEEKVMRTDGVQRAGGLTVKGK